MKNKQIISILFIALISLFSCSKNNDNVVKDFITSLNTLDKSKLESLLDDSFVFNNKEKTMNKNEYLENLDLLKDKEMKINLISIQNFDSIVKTEEESSNIVDSLLEVTPKIVMKRTYRFNKGKIKSIMVDTILNVIQHDESLNNKLLPFIFYTMTQHNIQNENEIEQNISKYLNEYVSLPQSEKNKCKTYAFLQGTYVSKRGFIKMLIFRGKKTVTTVESIMGTRYTTSYEIDEQFIKIKNANNSDILLEIKDNKTLIGEGLANGIFTKLE